MICVDRDLDHLWLDDADLAGVPADTVMELLGDRNWWLPKWLDRLLPHVEIERSDTSHVESSGSATPRAEIVR